MSSLFPFAASTLWLTILALMIEAVFSYPQPLYRRIGHPVTYMGGFLALLERKLNLNSATSVQRKISGILALVILLVTTALICQFLLMLLPKNFLGLLLAAVCASSLIAQRSLYAHVLEVAIALERDSLENAQKTVAKIVGRNTSVLDESGVARAAIESLAENFADGIVAPTFWLAIGGLTTGALYKAINTADSMIGHKNSRYREFGWAAARLDDFVNWPAARLAALLLACAAVQCGTSRSALHILWRDAGNHRSPNAGWPEAAMAGALGVKLAGPRRYDGVWADDAFLGDGRDMVDANDIRVGLKLYSTACALQFIFLLIIAFILRS